ncbi:cysteine hydrolase [Xylophilus sp. GW821-FHT01B05]
MTPSIQLLIIDPQNDFCDLPADWCPTDGRTGQPLAPALPVAGAHADMLRLARLIDAGAGGLTRIAITLDSHHRYDIAHPTFWQTGSGADVAPFTSITAAQVRAGDYAPRAPSALPRALAYLDALEQRGRYTLMVWPVHCEIGSWGHNVHSAVKAAYNRWEDSTLGLVQKISKGSNPWTEHYSAMQAEVPDAEDPATQLNTGLIATLDQADLIVIAGEASSHCVKATTEHIVQNLPSGRPGKVVLLTDCMSPVGGFEAQHQAFLDDMRRQGVVLTTSVDFLPQLQA